MEREENILVEHYRIIDDLRADFRNSNLVNLIASLVKGKTVVDIGCGSGFFAQTLQRVGKEVVGIEPEGGMRELAARINPDVKVIPGKAEEVDFLVEKPVDTVVMMDVLEHVEDDVEQVKKVRAVLKDSGEFILVLPAYPFLYGERDKQMKHYRRYTRKSIERILKENGFSVTNIRSWNALGFFPYLISEKVLKRPLRAEFRGSEKGGILAQVVRRGLHIWFRYIENMCNFGFGLSIIVVAKKI